MKKLNIQIISNETQRSFDIFLRLTGWWGFQGKWECLPGYLFENGGYFWLNTSYNTVAFTNRQMTGGEAMSYAFTTTTAESMGVIEYMFLERINGTISVGSQGNGHVFHYGKTGRETMRKEGFYGGPITWKVTSVE